METLSWKIVVLLIIVLVALCGIICFLPLFTWSDSSAYYFSMAKLLSGSRKFSVLGGYEWFMPVGMSSILHYAALMSLGSEWGSKLFVLPVCLAGAIVLSAIAGTVGVDKRGKWLVLAMYFSSTVISLSVRQGKDDIFGATLGISAFFFIMQTDNVSVLWRYCIAGVLAGFAIVAKISYLPLIIPCSMLFILLWENQSGDRKNIILKNISIFFAGLSLPLLLHIVKNYVLIGEPLAPFFYLKGDPGFGPMVGEYYSVNTTIKIILTYPLQLVYGRHSQQAGQISLLLVAFLPLGLLLKKADNLCRKKIFTITLTGMAGIVIWLLLRPTVFAPRYILYTLLLLMPLSAKFAECVYQDKTIPSFLKSAITAFCILYLILNINTVMKRSYIREYLADKGSEYNMEGSLTQAAAKLNKIAEPGTRILSLNYYPYWYRSDLLQCMSSGYELRKIYGYNNEVQTSYDAWTYIYERGFKYVFVCKYSGNMGFLNIKKIPEWLEVNEIINVDGNKVYKLTSNDPIKRPRISTKEYKPSIWKIVDSV
jgi:hypothetical protein